MNGTSTPGLKDPPGQDAGYEPVRGSSEERGIKETVTDTKEALQKKGAEVAGDAKDRAEEMADEQMKIGAEHAQRIAGAVQKAADDLSQSSPLLAHYARNLASGISSVSDTMRTRPTGRLVSDVSGYASREPLVFFGAAVAAGFALSRFLKSSSEQSSGRSDGDPGRLGGSAQDQRTSSQERKHESR